jgi:hypothetical protein
MGFSQACYIIIIIIILVNIIITIIAFIIIMIIIINIIDPRYRVLQKQVYLIVKLVNKFPTFYGNTNFISVFTTVCQ